MRYVFLLWSSYPFLPLFLIEPFLLWYDTFFALKFSHRIIQLRPDSGHLISADCWSAQAHSSTVSNCTGQPIVTKHGFSLFFFFYIYISEYSFSLYQLLYQLIINNLMCIIFIHLYYSGINLLNYILN